MSATTNTPRSNKSYGLTTLKRANHVRLTERRRGVRVSRKERGDAQDRLPRRPAGAHPAPAARPSHGQRLFSFVDHDGLTHAVGSHDVNAYIREAIGADFSAKDFRTWMGTLAAAHALSMQDRPTSPTNARKIMNTCVKAVAGLLGNTPTVCRKCYIHPVVFEAYEADALDKRLTKDARDAELALLKLLSEREAAKI